MRQTPIIAGNWKMHKTSEEAVNFIHQLKPHLRESVSVAIFLAVPFTALRAVSIVATGLPLMIGAQNMHDAHKGAFTGEISASMLKAEGAEFVILGHSERRQLFQESNFFIQRKVKRALEEGLIPILCVGETEKDREDGKTEQILSEQIKQCLSEIPLSLLGRIILAYEPVWAIGTGKSASLETAQQTHLICRNLLSQISSEEIAKKISILYGGSVTSDNASALMSQPDIDGVLVGGGSLQVDQFMKIVHTWAPTQF